MRGLVDLEKNVSGIQYLVDLEDYNCRPAKAIFLRISWSGQMQLNGSGNPRCK